ncbi:MAG TPA: hypothetical protein EYO33_25545 [Phycisphaerales bacterium]|nr:hypothetical protein [Phycisphaerales bacterium]
MAQIGRIDMGAAPACPNCRQRVTDLNLDEIANGAEHQCLFCGHFMRVPKSVIDRLIEQREKARAAGAVEKESLWSRMVAFFSNLFRRR